MQPLPTRSGKLNPAGDRSILLRMPLRAGGNSPTLFTACIDDQDVVSGHWRSNNQETRLTFQHLEVVLTIVAHDSKKEGPTSGDASTEEDASDPVVLRLSAALKAVEVTEGTDADICVDALRLAIVTRMVGLRGKSGRSTDATMAAGAPGRKRCPLPKWRLTRVCEYIDRHLTSKITLPDLAAAAGLSRMHFAKQFRATTGMRPHDYVLNQRIQRGATLLRETDLSLAEIALTVGFQTQAHFTSVFKRFMGDTPHQWRSMSRIKDCSANTVARRSRRQGKQIYT